MSRINPIENIYVIDSADDLPSVLSQYVLYHLTYAGGLWYSPNGTSLLPVSGDYFSEVAKGNIPGEFLVSKFGSNPAVPNGSFELISSLSVAPYAGYLQAATTVRVKSGGNAADTAAGAGARTVTVEGIDDSLNAAIETLTLAGSSASSSSSTSFFRIHRAYVATVGSYTSPWNTAAIVIENTAGTADLITILAADAQTLHCQYTVPTGYDAYLVGISLIPEGNKSVDFELLTRANIDDVSVPVAPARRRGFWPGILAQYSPNIPFPRLLGSGPMDIFMEAQGNGAGLSASAVMDLHMVSNT